MVTRKTYIFILNLAISLLFLLPSPSYGQQRRMIQQVEQDTIPFFRNVAIGADLVGPGMIAFGSYGQYEGILRINLKDKYYPTVEVGVGKADKHEDTTGNSYKASAPYARVGLDFNVLTNKHDSYRALVGARIGYTSFKYDYANAGIIDPIWQTPTGIEVKDVKSNMLWAEIVAGLDAKLWGPIRLGWNVRYKARLHQKKNAGSVAWYVPGYGKNGSTRIGAEFNMMFEF